MSSITSNYGDDVKTLNEILSRQGSRLLMDVISEYARNTALRFSMSADDRKRLADSLCDSLRESLAERL